MGDKYIEFTVGQKVYDIVREEYGVVEAIDNDGSMVVYSNRNRRCFTDPENWYGGLQTLVPVGTEVSLSIPVLLTSG